MSGVVKAVCRLHVTKSVEGLMSSQVEHHLLVSYHEDVCDEHSSREPTATAQLTLNYEAIWTLRKIPRISPHNVCLIDTLKSISITPAIISMDYITLYLSR
jgi:hypothetical protein